MSIPVIHQEFLISTDYYGTEVFIEIQGVDFTRCASPKGGQFGDPLITNSSTGRLEGQLVIVNTLGMTIFNQPGVVNIDFVMRIPAGSSTSLQREGVRFIQDTETSTDSFISKLIARIPMRILAPGESARSPIPVDPNNSVSLNSSGQTNTAITSDKNFITTSIAPLAQTFYVGTKFKNGVYCPSIELFFYKKSSTSGGDVRVSIRTVENGLPTNKQLSDALAIVSNDNINVSTSLGAIVPTKFAFPYPIYLAADREYAFTVTTPDENYLLYLGVLGKETSNTNVSSNVTPSSNISLYERWQRTVYPSMFPRFIVDAGLGLVSNVLQNTPSPIFLNTKEPGVGKLYQLSNAGPQVEEKGASILFKINKAIFETGVKTFVKQTVNLAPASFRYDTGIVTGNFLDFGDDTNITAQVQTKRNTSGTFNDYVNVQLNTPKEFSETQVVKDAGDFKVRISFENKDKNITPALDLTSLRFYTKKWEIDSIDDAEEIRETEYLSTNGFAKSKYISKIVTLNPEFDSTGLEVKLNVNRKNNTDIDVFCRVKSSLDSDIGASIEKNTWKLMPLYSSANSVSDSGVNYSVVAPAKITVGTTNAFVAETYRILETDSSNLVYTTNINGSLATFNTFNQFQVKIVMYGDSNANRVPVVKNLIATAVI